MALGWRTLGLTRLAGPRPLRNDVRDSLAGLGSQMEKRARRQGEGSFRDFLKIRTSWARRALALRGLGLGLSRNLPSVPHVGVGGQQWTQPGRPARAHPARAHPARAHPRRGAMPADPSRSSREKRRVEKRR